LKAVYTDFVANAAASIQETKRKIGDIIGMNFITGAKAFLGSVVMAVEAGKTKCKIMDGNFVA
jgi:hypothetical protein